MPTLDWIGKKAVLNHHNEVPFRLLKRNNALSVGDPGSGNLLVQGDNLEALKALLPYYAGQVKCIYIDPPYNTGNENWVYNDNVNSPEIKDWLGKVAGKDAEDLSRHDKWLCMMYPRLSLLKYFLRKDGLIFVSIDDNEACFLKLLLDEIFGPDNFQQQLIWKNKYGPGAMTKGFGNIHEYIFCYSNYPVSSIQSPLSESEIKKYSKKDDKYAIRGGYITQPLATRSKDDRPNLVYPLLHNGEEILPDKQWIWSEERLKEAIANGEVEFRKSKGKWSVRFKQYLRDEKGKMRLGKPISIMIGPFNQDGTKEIETIFGDKRFNNPKPTALIKYLISFIVNGKTDDNFLVLDSFAGSGSTGHAALRANKEDGLNANFILVEMDKSICANITRERIKNVVETQSIAQGFSYLELGPTLFDSNGHIRAEVSFCDLSRHVYFSETGEAIPTAKNGKTPLLGVYQGRAIYLLYNGILKDKSVGGGNVLTGRILAELPPYDGAKVIYGTACRISAKRLKQENIVFKQTPYEIRIK